MINKESLDSLKKIIEDNLHQKVEELTYLGRGACNNIYYCKTSSNKYSIKQERNEKLDIEKNDLYLESQILKLLELKEIDSIPRIIFEINNPKLFCYEYIEGTPLDEKWSLLSNKERSCIMAQLGKFHALLHLSLSDNEVNSLDILKNTNNISSEISKFRNILDNTTHKNDSLFNILSIIEKQYEGIEDTEIITGLLHGDLHRGNALVHNGQLSGVVDFGNCEFGDINRDFSHYARHYLNCLDEVINAYNTNSVFKLNKKRIIIYGMLKDIEKITYHLNKFNMGKQKYVNKIDNYMEALQALN